MIIVSTFNKGGVGKTTVAVHVAAVLAERRGGQRTLLVDCVDQYDSYRFFTRSAPEEELCPVAVGESLTVVWNPDRRPLCRYVDLGEYDDVVMDLNSPQVDTVQVILADEPDRLLIPINDQALADSRLNDTFAIVSALEDKAGAALEVVVVPLGRSLKEVREVVDGLTERPESVRFSNRFRRAADEFQTALRDGTPVWEQHGCEQFRKFFERLTM